MRNWHIKEVDILVPTATADTLREGAKSFGIKARVLGMKKLKQERRAVKCLLIITAKKYN